MKKTLLIEIGTEELPAKILYKLSLHFYNNFVKKLYFYNISYSHIDYFSTPRRLALLIKKIDTKKKITKIVIRGPSIKSAFDENGLPTLATQNWCQHHKIDFIQTHCLKNKNGAWLAFSKIKKQKRIQHLLPNIVESAIKSIVIDNPMRWTINNEEFSRPIRNIVMLLDDEIIPGKIFNVASNNVLQNHICSKEHKICIHHAQEYPLILFQKNKIIADFKIRKKIVKKITKKLARNINGIINTKDDLVEEVTALVESPKALLVQFKKQFLSIPKKILIHIIETQQKCFPIYTKKKSLLPYFIFISNIHSQNPKNIISGNEKVMNARLSDVKFFFQKDKHKRLIDYLPSLKKIIFQKNLGSLYEKTLRIKFLVQWISLYSKSDAIKTVQAAMLSKCDLATDMVSEFPELKGIVGMYYAHYDQENKEVAIALKEQYLPSFSHGKLPKTIIGSTISIAEKIDTLSGMFLTGKNPNSNKDPFSLRRLSIGILRIIITNNISLDIKNLIKKSLDFYNKKNVNYSTLCINITNFFMTRLFYWYEEQGYNIKIIKAVLSCKLTIPIDIHYRIQAISNFEKLNSFKPTILYIKRIYNILQKNHQKISDDINMDLIQQEEEKILLQTIEYIYKITKNLFIEKKYQEILSMVHVFDIPINNFFNNVYICHENQKIQINRFILLNKLKKFFFKIANFSYLF
jgi:glycyl-tRNA synthetase beta chain